MRIFCEIPAADKPFHDTAATAGDAGNHGVMQGQISNQPYRPEEGRLQTCREAPARLRAYRAFLPAIMPKVKNAIFASVAHDILSTYARS